MNRLPMVPTSRFFSLEITPEDRPYPSELPSPSVPVGPLWLGRQRALHVVEPIGEVCPELRDIVRAQRDTLVNALHDRYAGTPDGVMYLEQRQACREYWHMDPADPADLVQ